MRLRGNLQTWKNGEEASSCLRGDHSELQILDSGNKVGSGGGVQK